MSFFTELGSKAFSPVKAGANALYDSLTPDPKGVLFAPSQAEKDKGIMKSFLQTGMEAMQPGYAPNPQDMIKQGQLAMSGAPVFTDSSQTLAVAPEKEGKGFDLEALGETLKSVKAPPQSRGGGSVQTGSARLGGRFSLDRSLYENPLVKREFDSMYMAPLYQDYTRR